MYDVLFVDDDISLRFIVSKMKVWNYSDFKITKQAKNGQEALELLESYNFHVVITDIRMPIIDGIELLEIIRERNIDVLVVLVSTYSEFEYAKRGLQLGAVDYVIKPLKEEALAQVLTRLEEKLVEKYEKNNNIYVISQDKIKKWTSYIIKNQFLEKEMFEDFYKQIVNMGIYQEDTYPIIIKDIVDRIWEEIILAFPWLKYIIELKVSITKENLYEDVIHILNVLKHISDKYMLYKQDNFINRVCIIIMENIENGNIIDIISEKMELSKDYIGKQFKNIMNITLIEYCTIMKIEYSKKLLHDTSKKIYEISDVMGYATVDYFTKLFKKYTGETPTKYRKKIEIL